MIAVNKMQFYSVPHSIITLTHKNKYQTKLTTHNNVFSNYFSENKDPIDIIDLALNVSSVTNCGFIWKNSFVVWLIPIVNYSQITT